MSEDQKAYGLITEHKDMFITLELCLVSALGAKRDPNVLLTRCLKKLQKRLKHSRNQDMVKVLRESDNPALILIRWLRNGDEKHAEFDRLIEKMRGKLQKAA